MSSQKNGAALVIDCMADSRRFIKSSLIKLGYEKIFAVGSYEDAVKFIKDKKEIEIVISGYYLGEEHTGVDVFKLLSDDLKNSFLMVYPEEEQQLVFQDAKSFNNLRMLKRPFSQAEFEVAINKGAAPRSGQGKSRKITKDSKILVIDDFEMMRVMMKNAFMELGYLKLEEAADGEAALEKLNEAAKMGEPFDLIFSDWNMPEMDGLELFRVCSNNMALKDIPFVMVTAENEKSNVIMAINEGVTNYIVKPLTPETLVEKLRKVNEKLE